MNQESVRLLSRVAFWGVIRALLLVINICYPQPSFSSPLINEDLPAGPQLVFTLNNRFFRHQACHSLLPAKLGGQADRVISLCKYKVVEYTLHPSRNNAYRRIAKVHSLYVIPPSPKHF